jgi:hypothetical protein
MVKSYVLTLQRPGDQAQMDKVMVDPVNGQLQAKDFTLDEKNPDFEIKYEADAAPQAATSAQPYMVYGGTPDPSQTVGGERGVYARGPKRSRTNMLDTAA